MNPIGFDEDRFAPVNSTDLLPLPTECAFDGCTADRITPEYPMCSIHAPYAHYRYRMDCLCVSCVAKRAVESDVCCEEFVWGNPCNCAAAALAEAA